MWFFGAVFAAAGAAVNDMKEAQALMGPVMLLLMGPWMLAFPIMRAPDSTLAVVLSFVPPVNTFAMMLRLASSNPPPLWQTLLSIAIGIAAADAGAIWFAAKVFRIGLLMHGKPPNMRTLVRDGREAGLGLPRAMSDLGRHVRLQLPGMEGQLLSGDAPGGQDAAVLRGAVSDRRDQLHVLPDADEKIVDGWNRATPDRYALTLKAPKRITHDARLRNCGDRVQQFLEAAATLGPEARRAAVPAAAEYEEGSRAARRRFSLRFRRASAPRSSSVMPRGSTKRCTSGCGRESWRCASRTARSSRRRSS